MEGAGVGQDRGKGKRRRVGAGGGGVAGAPFTGSLDRLFQGGATRGGQREGAAGDGEQNAGVC